MNSSEPLFGRYHAFLPTGSYDIRFEADGYDPLTLEDVFVDTGASLQLDVTLTRPGSFIGEEGAGVSLLEPVASPAGTPVRLQYRLMTPGPAQLQVLDVRGGLVRTLLDGFGQPGEYQVSWDGRDDRGQRVVTGSYFCHLRTGQSGQTRRLLWIR
jgi:hypothetical protein